MRFQLKFVICLQNITLIWNEGWTANGMDVKPVADDNEVLNLKDMKNSLLEVPEFWRLLTVIM